MLSVRVFTQIVFKYNFGKFSTVFEINMKNYEKVEKFTVNFLEKSWYILTVKFSDFGS